MKNLKPFLLGCMAGCGAMFLALQYHVVQSHDGLQLVPRAPQVSLGLAWADVRGWDAETWAERPQLARALVAHGSSDLIAESVAREIAGSADPDSGTIGQLRSLLNDSMSPEFDAPLFNRDGSGSFRESDGDSLAIPFPSETRKPNWDDLFTLGGEDSRTNVAGRSNDFADLEDVISQENERQVPERISRSNERRQTDPFAEAESSWRTRRESGRAAGLNSNAEARVRETTILEDLLFSEEDDDAAIPSDHMDSAIRKSRFESLTRALDSRASRALDRAGSDFTERPGSSHGYVRDRGIPSDWSKPSGSDSVPHAIRALRDGFDPFLK